MTPFTAADLTALHDRPAGFIKNVLWGQYLGYEISENSNLFSLISPFYDESIFGPRIRGPFDTKEKAWKSGIDWGFKGGKELYFLMKQISRPDCLDLHNNIWEECIDGVYIEHVRIRWRLRGYTYIGDSHFYGDGAMNAILKYCIRQAKSTGPLTTLTEAGIGLAAALLGAAAWLA